MKLTQTTHLFLIAVSLATTTLRAEKAARSAADAKNPEALFSAVCEHKIPQYTCDECRYELGLVKLDPSLSAADKKADTLINIQTVAKRKAQTLLPLNGEIALNESTLTHVSPRVEGTVRTIKTEVGKQVRKGDVLFDIESPSLGLAIGAYRKNAALAALARKNFEREKALADQKLSPQADAVDAQMKYDEYRVELESAKNALAVMGLDEAAVMMLTSDGAVNRTPTLPVKSPQGGTVISKNLAPGETVGTDKDVLTIADLSTVWVWLNVYESDLPQLTEEAKARKLRVQITLPSAPGRAFEGEIDLIGTLMDENTRTVRVRATLKNPDGLLRPGMFCEARAVFDTEGEVVAVPRAAVMADEGKQFVFRIVRDRFALRTEVVTGRLLSDDIEVRSGLPEGEKIVTGGAFILKSDVLRSKMGAGCAD